MLSCDIMKIINNLIKAKWLIYKIFGSDMTRKKFYDPEIIFIKQLLKNSYWFHDVDAFFPDVLKSKEVDKSLKILYQYSWDLDNNNNNNGNW